MLDSPLAWGLHGQKRPQEILAQWPITDRKELLAWLSVYGSAYAQARKARERRAKRHAAKRQQYPRYRVVEG